MVFDTAIAQKRHSWMDNRCVSGDLKIGLALSATNDLDDGGSCFRVGTGLGVWVGLRKKLKKLGFNFFSFVLVHQFFFLIFLRG